MTDSRATLKTFFETGDVPTQAQFEALIDSLLSLVDDSNLKNGIKIKSETDGKLQLVFNESSLEMTTDGGGFAEADLLLSPAFAELAVKAESIGIFITGGANPNVKFRGQPTATPSSFYSIGNEADVAVDRGLFITEVSLKENNLIPSFDDDADAGSGGLTTGDFYQTTGLGPKPLDVAGIVVIKQ